MELLGGKVSLAFSALKSFAGVVSSTSYYDKTGGCFSCALFCPACFWSLNLRIYEVLAQDLSLFR